MNILEKKEGIEKVEQEKTSEIINTLDATATNLKIKNLSKDLEDKTETAIKTLQRFSEAVPPLVDRIEKINSELKLEEFEEKLKAIEEAATVTRGAIKILSNTARNSMQELSTQASSGIENLIEKGINSIDNKETASKLVNKTILGVFIALLFVNVGMFFFYRSYVKDATESINRNNSEINQLHNILSEDSKYWYNIENKKIYIKDMEIKNKNSNK